MMHILEAAALIKRIPKVEIKTGSLDNFSAELDRVVGREVRTISGVVSCELMGVKVQQSNIIPDDMAVVLSDGQIVAVVRF